MTTTDNAHHAIHGGDGMTRTPPDRARRMDEARRSLKAAIRGMDKALRADWMKARGGTYDDNL